MYDLKGYVGKLQIDLPGKTESTCYSEWSGARKWAFEIHMSVRGRASRRTTDFRNSTMMASMLHRLVAPALLAIGSLYAQQPTEAQLSKLYSQMDDALGLYPGATIADIGTGFAVDHALRMAEKLTPGGKIVCVDVKPSVIAKIKEQADARHITNLEVVLGGDDDPKLSLMTFDAILISNTYHEFTTFSNVEAHLRRAQAGWNAGYRGELLDCASRG